MKNENRQKARLKIQPECTSLTEFIFDSGTSDPARLSKTLQKHAVNPSVEALRATSMLLKVSEGSPAEGLAGSFDKVDLKVLMVTT